MDILGIGPLELFFVIIIALVILGPNDMIKTGKSIGRFFNRIVTSPNWKLLLKTSKEIKNLPTVLMREANLEDSIHDLKSATETNVVLDLPKNDQHPEPQSGFRAWTEPPAATGQIRDD